MPSPPPSKPNGQPPDPPNDPPTELGIRGPGSGFLARQPTPDPDEAIVVEKVCPQCGAEYATGSRFCLKDGTPLRPKAGADPLIGRVIADRYLILARLGEGGMGRVYLAEHVKMNRQCAVKVMNPQLVNDHESAARFAREASSAARILHPNVAAVFDYGESDKIVYLVMEYVDGEPLSAILAREGRLDPRRAIDLGRQVADGLAVAHEMGIVHRDLKPDNVIVAQGKNGREIPKIVDFGIAKAVSETPQDALTRSGLVIGTPEYMSPEQLLGDPVDARADVYSLGCILYQMLTGTQAFAAESREQMIRRRLHEPAPHVRDLVPEVPRPVDTLIAHMLARTPGDRIASAAEVRDALDPALALADWSKAAGNALRPTPRSMPTTSFEAATAEAALHPTVPLERQGATTRYVWIKVITGVVLIAAVALLANRGSGTGTKTRAALRDTAAAHTPPGAASQPSAATPAPIDTTVLTKPKAPVDTAAKRRDSIRAVESRIVVPLDQFRSGLNTKSMRVLLAAYPSMPNDQKQQWERLFAAWNDVHASLKGVKMNIRGDQADVDFIIQSRLQATNSATPMESSAPWHAFLVKKGAKWQIEQMTRR